MPSMEVKELIFEGAPISCSDIQQRLDHSLSSTTLEELLTALQQLCRLISFICLSALDRAAAFIPCHSDSSGQTFLPSKRPMRGRGRETLQLGISIVVKPPEDDNETASTRDCKIEPIPDVLRDIIDRLFQLQLISVKPDACLIDFFNEGDYSHPHTCPPWFGRPLSSLFLTKCSMVFGRVMSIEHPGDYRGSLMLSLPAGSLLVMGGNSADFAKHAIPSIPSQRVIVTFTKVQSKKMLFADGPHLSPAATVPCGAAPPRHHPGPKNYGRVPSTVLRVPPVSPQRLPSNDMQPIFLGAPAARSVTYLPPPMPVPEASTTGRPSATGEGAQPTILVPGTGVFLPPAGTGQPPLQQQEGDKNEKDG